MVRSQHRQHMLAAPLDIRFDDESTGICTHSKTIEVAVSATLPLWNVEHITSKMSMTNSTSIDLRPLIDRALEVSFSKHGSLASSQPPAESGGGRR